MTQENMGMADRVIRAAVGIALVLGALAVEAPLFKIVLGLGALVMIGTALVGFCPLYRAVGLNTGGRPPR